MSLRSAKKGSVWIETGPDQVALPQLTHDVVTDVAIIGGGIVGITLALLLKEAGVEVVLLERDRLARGVTGYTTAKVSSQHGMVYSRLRSKFGRQAAQVYGELNQAALEWIAQRVEDDAIECDFRRQPAYVYMSESSGRSKVEQELDAAVEAGLPASLVESTPLPYPVEAAVRFDNQAEFHVRAYLLSLAQKVMGEGCEIYESSNAVEVDTDDMCVVKTPGGRVTASEVVVATHYPFLDRSLAFARVHPERSYAILCRIADEPPPGMYISGDSPTRSVRAVPINGEELLLVGGEGHKPGHGGDSEVHYTRLEEFAHQHWDVESVEYRWSAQDNTTIDTLPYVGRLTPNSDRVFMATGFAKWGMTGGTAAAMILFDLLQGRQSRGAELFDPNRFKPLAGAVKFVEENFSDGPTVLRGPYNKAREAQARGAATGRGRHRSAQRGEGGRTPLRRRKTGSRLHTLHAPRLPGELERGGTELGLPMPRFPLCS